MAAEAARRYPQNANVAATIALAAAINEKLGSVGTTVSYFAGPSVGCAAQLAQLAANLFLNPFEGRRRRHEDDSSLAAWCAVAGERRGRSGCSEWACLFGVLSSVRKNSPSDP